MKNYILFILAIAYIHSACNKDTLDINTNPNSVTSATPVYVFTNAQSTTARNSVLYNELGSYWSGQWTQSNFYINTPQIFSYQFNNSDHNFWDRTYDNLEDYQYVIENAEANTQKYLIGPAKVMQSILFQVLVDMYGNVPYSEALQGTKILSPKLDNQSQIYTQLITKLNTAIVDINENTFESSFTSNDIIFFGDKEKWIKLAQSIKLRLLIRLSHIETYQSFVLTELNKIADNPAGILETIDATIGGANLYSATAGKLNPLYARFGYSAAGARLQYSNYPRMTKYLVDLMKSNSDTFRLKRIAYARGAENVNRPGFSNQAENAVNYVGIPFGATAGFPSNSASSIGPAFITRGIVNRPIALITSSEVQFLLAEAKQRFPQSKFPLTAQEYYENGIKESFRYLGVPSRAAELISSNKPNCDWNASTNKLEAVAIQKWISVVNINGLEAWSEYRRTNFPAIPQSPSVPNSNRPLRLFYPNTENSTNPNISAEPTVDVFKSRIFWDLD